MFIDEFQRIKLASQRRGMHPVFQTQLHKIVIAREVDAVHLMQVALHDLCLFETAGQRVDVGIVTQDHRLHHEGVFPVCRGQHVADGKMLLFYPVCTGNGIERSVVMAVHQKIDRFEEMKTV